MGAYIQRNKSQFRLTEAGKSTVVEEFAKKEYDDYILIDFSTAEHDDPDVKILAEKLKSDAKDELPLKYRCPIYWVQFKRQRSKVVFLFFVQKNGSFFRVHFSYKNKDNGGNGYDYS